MIPIDVTISPKKGAGFRLHFEGPQSWFETRPRQAVALMRWRAVANELPASRFMALRILYGMKRRHLRWFFDRLWLRRKGVEAEDMDVCLELGSQLIDTIRWVGETEPDENFIVKSFRRYDFRYGSLPVLLARLFVRRQYWAPDAALGNCSFEEFICADKAFREGNLAELAAVLYRPKSRFGWGSRIPFSSEDLAVRSGRFTALDPALLQLIGSQFYACLSYLQRCFPHVFPENSGFEAQKTAKKGGNWLDIAINMVKLDPTKVREVERLNVYLALKVLDEQIRQADEAERQMEEIKNKNRP